MNDGQEALKRAHVALTAADAVTALKLFEEALNQGMSEADALDAEGWLADLYMKIERMDDAADHAQRALALYDARRAEAYGRNQPAEVACLQAAVCTCKWTERSEPALRRHSASTMPAAAAPTQPRPWQRRRRPG
ncbi:MAG: hypothetical protein KC492_20220 [Myxococcales bacterium]|nr:hypothetical protein [Myxococcales bacterium]